MWLLRVTGVLLGVTRVAARSDGCGSWGKRVWLLGVTYVAARCDVCGC